MKNKGMFHFAIDKLINYLIDVYMWSLNGKILRALSTPRKHETTSKQGRTDDFAYPLQVGSVRLSETPNECMTDTSLPSEAASELGGPKGRYVGRDSVELSAFS